jgi:glycerophosphoryl diester phosphodiesterase
MGTDDISEWAVTVILSCSLDGVPFLMHDTTLRRTTNVEHLFPELARRPAAMLNWTVLQRLNAGQWFLKVCLYLGLP